MFVCICNAVTDQDIQHAVNEGAKDVEDLKKQLALGTCCGCCVEVAQQYIDQWMPKLILPSSRSGECEVSFCTQRQEVSFW